MTWMRSPANGRPWSLDGKPGQQEALEARRPGHPSDTRVSMRKPGNASEASESLGWKPGVQEAFSCERR